jgi:uncharacterized SAM-binding protein YcdF (DUF218 family)
MLIIIIGMSSIIILALFVLLGHFFDKRNLPSAPADVALVFGTTLVWKARSRWETAAQLFKQGSVRYLIVSGGVRMRDTNVTEAEWFRANLIEHGIAPDRVIIENRATNTRENTELVLPILRQRNFQTVILVMSDFEGVRAHLTAKRAWQGHGITIYDYHAPSPGHWSPWTWWMAREGWHLTWYTLQRIFRYSLWKYLLVQEITEPKERAEK